MKKPVVYAFIDSQNLNLGASKDICRGGKKIYKGWKLDFTEFRKYLTTDFNVSKAFIFIGKVSGNEKLYRYLKRAGYNLVFKPTVIASKEKTKGNVDAELVLHAAAVEFGNYNKAVIVSGDGDFYCLHNFLRKNNKLLKIIIPNKYCRSQLLSEFQRYVLELNGLEKRLKKQIGRRGALPRG